MQTFAERQQVSLFRVFLIAIFSLYLITSPAFGAETVDLKSNEMHKVTDHVSFGIRFFGLTYLSFENPSEKNGNNIEGYKQIVVWDKGKLVTINVSDEDWQETRVRTTNGCQVGRRLSKAKFTYEVKPQAQPDVTKPIEGTEVKLVSVTVYKER